MSGTPYTSCDVGYPPYDTGIFAKTPGPTDTTLVVGFGHALYDNRFGLGRDMLTELEPMVRFTDDYSVTQERCSSGLSLTIDPHSGDAAIHAPRQELRETRGKFVPPGHDRVSITSPLPSPVMKPPCGTCSGLRTAPLTSMATTRDRHV